MTDLRAQFSLDFQTETGPLTKLEEIIGRLDRMLERLGVVGTETSGHLDRFNKVLDATSGVAGGATERTEKLYQALNNSGYSATVTAERLDLVNRSMAQMSRMTQEGAEALSQVDSRAERSIGVFERMSQSLGKARDGFSGVVHASHKFHESVERGVGQAFGAAAAGFGLVEPVRHAAEFDNTVRHIGIGLDLHGADNDKFAQSFGQQLVDWARSTNQSSEKLAEAAGFLSSEGYRGDHLNAVMPVVAKISTAYNADPEAVAKTSFALQESLGIGNNDLKGALAALAVAGKNAALPFEKMAPLLPQVASAAGAFGVKGRQHVNELAAMLAVARKKSGTEGEAVTNTNAFIKGITSNVGIKGFAKHRIDILKVEDYARAHGHNPMLDVLEVTKKLTNSGKNTAVMADLFNNLEERNFVSAMFQDWDKNLMPILKKLQGVTDKTIDEDYATGRDTLKPQMQAFDEALDVLTRRLGNDFAPVLQIVTAGLQDFEIGLEWLDKAFPGLSSTVLGVGGGVLALTAVMGALGAIAGPVAAGFGLLTAGIEGLGGVLMVVSGPVGWVVGGVIALGAGLYELYKHMDSVIVWVDKFCDGLLKIPDYFEKALAGLIAALNPADIWKHLTSYEPTFSKDAHPHLKDALGRDMGNLTPFQMAHLSQLKHFGPAVAARLPGAAQKAPPLEIHVKADKGLSVHAKPHATHRIHVLPNPGAMTGRP